MQDALGLLGRLLDPSEGALDVLQGGRHLRGWFLGHAHELGLGNVRDLLTHLLFRKGVQPEGTLLHRLSDTFVSALGLDLEHGTGHNPAATPLTDPQGPLLACYRPLLFYLLMEALAAWTHVTLTARMGFERLATTGRATAYYIMRGAADNTQPPLVLLHGIGLGLAPYTAFLSRLSAAHPGRTIIAVQYKHVSMRLSSQIPSVNDVAEDVLGVLGQEGVTQAAIIGHSYGTLVASAITKRAPELTKPGLVLIDPVCFAMFLPTLIRNALYFHAPAPGAAPDAAEGGAGEKSGQRTRFLSLKGLLKGVVVRDMHCAAALTRDFHWADLNLWASEVPANSTVVLSGADHLVPVAEVTAMLAAPSVAARNIAVKVMEGRGHGGFLLHPQEQYDLLSIAPSLAPVAGSAGAAAVASGAAAVADALAAAAAAQEVGPEQVLVGELAAAHARAAAALGPAASAVATAVNAEFERVRHAFGPSYDLLEEAMTAALADASDGTTAATDAGMPAAAAVEGLRARSWVQGAAHSPRFAAALAGYEALGEGVVGSARQLGPTCVMHSKRSLSRSSMTKARVLTPVHVGASTRGLAVRVRSGMARMFKV